MPCTTAGAPSWHKLVAVYAKLQVPAHFDLSADATSAASLLLDPWAHEPSDLDDDDEEEEAAATAAGGAEEDEQEPGRKRRKSEKHQAGGSGAAVAVPGEGGGSNACAGDEGCIKGQVCRFGLRAQGLGLRTKGLGRVGFRRV